MIGRQFALNLGKEARETRLRSRDSRNSLNFDPTAVEGLIQKCIRSESIAMPPTRDGLRRLFEAMNLDVSPVKCLDCMVYCRGKKMENSNPDDFDMKRLVQWFMLNLRTFKHADEAAADRDWREDAKLRGDLAR